MGEKGVWAVCSEKSHRRWDIPDEYFLVNDFDLLFWVHRPSSSPF